MQLSVEDNSDLKGVDHLSEGLNATPKLQPSRATFVHEEKDKTSNENDSMDNIDPKPSPEEEERTSIVDLGKIDAPQGSSTDAKPASTLPKSPQCTLTTYENSNASWQHPTTSSMSYSQENTASSSFNVAKISLQDDQNSASGVSSNNMPSYVKEEAVVKNRHGSVLTRGLVLKTDFFAGMRRPDLGLLLQGAPNFRQASVPGLQVYGVAQPTTIGLKTILSVLQCGPSNEVRGRNEFQLSTLPLQRTRRSVSSSSSLSKTKTANSEKSQLNSPRRCVWVCTRNEPVIYVGGRPFVLREAERPLDNFQLSGRGSNLESIEQRLKTDILREAVRYGGLLMVHEEDESGGLRPAWIAVDAHEVRTVREVWDDIRDAGWRCDYHRIPIAEDQPMENNYLDAYTQIIKDVDPINTAFVANCGLGVRRTSFAMVAAVLVLRRLMMLQGYADPLTSHGDSFPDQTQNSDTRSTSLPNLGVAKSMEAASQQNLQAQSTLEVVKTLSNSLSDVGGSHTAVEVLLYQPLLLNSLRSARNGDYGVIGQLVGLLDQGDYNKRIVDKAINACSQVINLRHSILEARVRYAVEAPKQESARTIQKETSRGSLKRAAQALEQYYFLITFASYVEGSETATFQHSFATWLRSRAETWHTIAKIRSKGQQLYFFDPIADLSALSRSATNQDAKGGSTIIRRSDTDPHLIPGDEFAEHVVRNRNGLVLRPMMLLKEDIWRSLDTSGATNNALVRGAINFRQIPGSRIFATGQPTVEGIRNILRTVGDRLLTQKSDLLQVTYINLREEPICHVNGKPYCLRQKGMSLRNITSYSGISWSRLTLLEDRLKNDVLSELNNGDGRLLLHTETQEGGVVPIWEEASANEIETLQDVMTKLENELDHRNALSINGDSTLPNIHLIYRRLPITAEKPPSFEDLSSILTTVLRSEVQSNACVVLNCQLGRGRSTLVSIIALLISRWLGRFTKDNTGSKDGSIASSPLARRPLTYHLINSLLRVIPHGIRAKDTVDQCIDRCDGVLNLREAIEDARISAENTDDEQVKRSKIQAGVNHFRRYFQLIVFQAYLDATPPSRIDSMQAFEQFVRRQPVFSTFWNESDKVDITTITPLQKVDQTVGIALDDEVQEVISNRAGNVLSSYTMLKSDMFPGLAAQALSQIDGIPNLRGEHVLLGSDSDVPSTPWLGPSPPQQLSSIETWGHGMPSINGLRKGLKRMGAAPEGALDVIATSLREEAVCVINGRPHVLRLADQPFTNVETTGITTDAVERMEEALKHDVLIELEKYDGRILLHDERVDDSTGKFEIFPIWEKVNKEDVLTPKEMYQMVQAEGYRVHYARVAVTDEQAPIPAVFHEMEERVLEALRKGAALVWNCQMGRGRTTTGMIIAAMVSTVAIRSEDLFGNDLSASALSGSMSGFLVGSGSQIFTADSSVSNNENVDDREDQVWLQGEYRTVMQLVAILRHGKLAKRLTDTAIDRMDAVQNLRKAIYDSKLRAANAEASQSRRAHLLRVYRNYLERYGYLIVFANYLLEKAQALVENGSSYGGLNSFPGKMDTMVSLSDKSSEHSNENEDINANDDEMDESASMTSISAASRISTGTTTSLFVREESRRIFPNFINWLLPRREISAILRREDLE